MLAQEIAVVNHMAFGRRRLSREIDVAPTAVSRVPLALVRVAAEARRMLDSNVVRVDRDVHMTSHAVSCARLFVDCVGKAQVLAGHLSGLAISGPPMAVGAGAGIMRILMALYAIGSRGEVQRARFSGFLDAGMALEAIDALDHVGTVLECSILFVLLEAEHLRARSH
jgi:hypothetical protein